MRRVALIVAICMCGVALLSQVAANHMSRQAAATQASSAQAATSAYLGFDRNIYPGDDAFPVLRKTFVFTGYWLGPPPGEKTNTWEGKRDLLHSLGFGFALLYSGRESRELKTENAAKQKGSLDARNAAASAKKEGFPTDSIIFLDIEEGGRLSPAYHAYLRNWFDELTSAGYRPGVYCSGIPGSEGHGATILTSDDIRHNAGERKFVYWVYNDVCPPAPGCGAPKNPPPVSSGGVPYAAIWQFAQSPRNKDRTKRCAATYAPDGNCYAPGDTSHAWFLDVNSALTADPSAPSQ